MGQEPLEPSMAARIFLTALGVLAVVIGAAFVALLFTAVT